MFRNRWKKHKHWTKTVGDLTAVVIPNKDGYQHLMYYGAGFYTPMNIGLTYPTAHAAMSAAEATLEEFWADPVGHHE